MHATFRMDADSGLLRLSTMVWGLAWRVEFQRFKHSSSFAMQINTNAFFSYTQKPIFFEISRHIKFCGALYLNKINKKIICNL